AGSLGLDLATTIDVTLVNNEPQKIPTTFKGPLHSDGMSLGALLIRQSSAGLKCIMVCLGIIDADFTGTVHVVAYTLHPPIFIPCGSKIAQLVLMKNLLMDMQPRDAVQRPFRRDAGFGSTGPVACLTMSMQSRPTATITMRYTGEQR
ncbi:DUT nucleotidohydrolase, partial [Irena cyanogastra]|nr:DUT nucleotidohydrolase [Irena cyanogastra]